MHSNPALLSASLQLMALMCFAVHTMAELKLSGNHLKGSRPVLSFDAAFDEQPHLQLMKEMFTQAFATPRRHPKSKPFHDHVISFHILDNRLWLRNYQASICCTVSAFSAIDNLAMGQTWASHSIGQ